MAAISHASVIVFGPGILVGVFIWHTQKEKTAYASNQGLQAAIYQLIGMIVVVGMWVVWGIFYALTWFPFVHNPKLLDGPSPPIFWVGMISMVIPLLVMLVWSLYKLWGAIRTFQSKVFHYVLIGNLLPEK